MTTEIITQVADSDKEVYLVRYRHPDPIWNGLWAICFHEDPALDFAVDPQGYTRTSIWNPFGPYSHPAIPDELFEQLNALLNAFA